MTSSYWRFLVAKILFCVCLFGTAIDAWGSKDKVLLTDVATLTLYNGRVTIGRRSRPIPQLKCVGGTASCKEFVPQVVQCYNRGSNGNDVQWECKTDMDNTYRFGQVTVACEGYDYADDPYILQGSCGLEYTLDLTKEGLNRKSGSHDYYGQSHHKEKYYKGSPSYLSKGSAGLKDLIVLAVVCIIIYGIYKTCIANQTNGAEYGGSAGPGPDTHPQRPSWFGSFFGGGYGGAPPPYGFRPDFASDGCGGGGTPRGSASGAGSFWTGAATGGILGYMFGNRGNRGYGTEYSGRSHGDAWGGTSNYSSGTSSGPSSSGTRTASGFGETRRR